MNAPQLYALTTCASGLLLLFGWAYVTTDNPRSNRILLKSVLLFVMPIGVVVALPERLFQFPLSMWLVVLIEESLKATAASTEQRPNDRFVLVALFGIWELVWVKPLWGLDHFAILEDRKQSAIGRTDRSWRRDRSHARRNGGNLRLSFCRKVAARASRQLDSSHHLQ
jgi:hypothetical protein